jgi:hypothetical protein
MVVAVDLTVLSVVSSAAALAGVVELTVAAPSSPD